MDLLAVVSRVLLAVALIGTAAIWALVLLGRYRPRATPDPSALERAQGPWLLGVGCLIVAVVLGLFNGDGSNVAGAALATTALGGWARERLVRVASSKQ